MVSSAGLNDLCSVRKLFLISGNGGREKSRSRFADRLAQYCFIYANFGRPFRIFFPVPGLVLSLSGSFALSAVFIRLYLRLRFTVIAYVNDRGEKIKKDCRRVKNACIHLSVQSTVRCLCLINIYFTLLNSKVRKSTINIKIKKINEILKREIKC